MSRSAATATASASYGFPRAISTPARAPGPDRAIGLTHCSDALGRRTAKGPFTVAELEDLTGLTTDGNGTATFHVPVTLAAATIVFSDNRESWQLVLGGMDPIDTLGGVFKRLQNLHYIGAQAILDQDDPAFLEVVRQGLRRLKAAHAPADASSTDSSSADASLDSSPPNSAPASGAGPDSNQDDDDSAPVDREGLDDDGNLDDDTRSLLVNVYGC